MSSTDNHMTQADLFARRMERNPILRSTIVSVLLLDSEPRWPDMMEVFERASRLVPLLREVVSEAPMGLAPPRWIPDTGFDLSWHMRRAGLPPPADMSTVLDFAGREIMTAFDAVRPLWNCTLLTGLPRGRAAVVLKIHHSLTDGIGAIRIAEEVLDTTRTSTHRDGLADPSTAARGAVADMVAWNWVNAFGLLRRGPGATVSALRRTATDPLGSAGRAARFGRSLVRLTRPVATTLSPVMTGRGTGRRLAVLQVPLADLLAAARRAGCTMNDVFLTAVLVGVREYHRRHGVSIDNLRVTMPISMRAPDDPPGGNRITLSRLTVPTGDVDNDALVRSVHAITDRWRHEPALGWSGAVAAVLNRMPTAVSAGILEHIDLVASNVPGSPVPLYLAGARVDSMYAFAPTLGTAFNVALVSHVDTCFIGLNVDTTAVPDSPLLLDSIRYGFATMS